MLSSSTQHYHVWVVPMARARHWLKYILIGREPIHYGEDTLPRVFYITIVSPEITYVCQECVVHLEKRCEMGYLPIELYTLRFGETEGKVQFF